MRERSVGGSAILAGIVLLTCATTADAARPSQNNSTQTKSVSAAPAGKSGASSTSKTSASTSSVTRAPKSGTPAGVITPRRPLIGSAHANTGAASPIAKSTGRKGSAKPTVLALRGQPLSYSQPSMQAGYRMAYGRGYGNNYRNTGRHQRYAAYSAGRGVGGGGGMSCVPYARSVTGMNVSGNAWQWWDNAAGEYARGQVPEAGSVLAFRHNMRMPMGHVAVISSVESQRVVTIDHANWPVGGRRGSVSRGISVVDVSERNDWSAVRVALGQSGDFGSIYPTHGFIYNRPDAGGIRMTNRAPAPMLALNAPPADLRGRYDRNRAYYADRAYDEVAEAPTTERPAEQRAITPFAAPIRPYSVIIPSSTFTNGN